MPGAVVYDLGTEQDFDIGVGQVDKVNPAGGTVRCNRVNLGSFAQGRYSASWVPGSIAALDKATVVVTVVGARAGDFVLASFDGDMTADLSLSGFIVVNDAVTVVLRNHSGSVVVNPGTGTLRVLVFKTNL